MATKRKQQFDVMRRFYVDAMWTISADNIEDAVKILDATKPADVLTVAGEVNDWGVIPGYGGVFEKCSNC